MGFERCRIPSKFRTRRSDKYILLGGSQSQIQVDEDRVLGGQAFPPSFDTGNA